MGVEQQHHPSRIVEEQEAQALVFGNKEILALC